MPRKKPVIELRKVKKIYTMGHVEVPALQGVDLKISRGDFIAIMGSSGSGKSTLLNMIGALDIPTSGKVLLDGIDIATLHESDLANIRGRKIGFVFQKFNLMQNFNAMENVSLAMIFQGVSGDERAKRARKLLEIVGLTHRLEHRPTEMSGGEQQRVAIARSLANDPDVVLADEPTGNLDSVTGEKIMKMKDGLTKTFIFSIIILLLSGFLWGMWTYYQAVYNDCVESQTKSGVPYHQATDTCLLRLEFHNED